MDFSFLPLHCGQPLSAYVRTYGVSCFQYASGVTYAKLRNCQLPSRHVPSRLCGRPWMFHSMSFPLHVFSTPFVSHSLCVPLLVFQSPCIPDPPCVFHSMCVKRYEYSTPYVSHYLRVLLPGSYTPCVTIPVCSTLCILLPLYSVPFVFHSLCIPLFVIPTPTHPKRVRPSSDP